MREREDDEEEQVWRMKGGGGGGDDEEEKVGEKDTTFALWLSGPFKHSR